MRAGRRIDQLTRNANLAAGPSDTSLKHIADTKLTADLLDIDRPALVSERRVTRDDEQRLEA